MRNNDVTLRIGADSSRLGGDLRRGEERVAGFGRRAAGLLKRSGLGLTRGIAGAIVNPFMGLLSGAAVLAASKQIVDYNSKLAHTAINSGISAREQMNLAAEISNVAMATGQSRDDVLAGVDAIVQRLGDIGLARDLLQDMALAATATGAGLGDMAALTANLSQKMGLSKKEIAGALNLLTVQGKAGSFELRSMADLGERLFSAAAAFNVRGMQGLRDFGAFIQIARSGTSSAEMAAEAVERFMSEVMDKAALIKKKTGGFSIFDEEKSRKAGVHVVKDFDAVIKGIIKGTKGDIPTLQQIFGMQSIRAIQPLAIEYQKTGEFGGYEKFKTADMNRKNELMKDFARYSKEASFSFAQAGEAYRMISEKALAPAIGKISEQLKLLASNPEKMQQYAQAIQALASSLLGIVNSGIWIIDKWGKVNQALADVTFGTTEKDLQRKVAWASLSKEELKRNEKVNKIGMFNALLNDPLGIAVSKQTPVPPPKGTLDVNIHTDVPVTVTKTGDIPGDVNLRRGVHK